MLLHMKQVHVQILTAKMEVHVWFWELRSPASVQLDSLDNFVKRPSVRIYMSLSVVRRLLAQIFLEWYSYFWTVSNYLSFRPPHISSFQKTLAISFQKCSMQCKVGITSEKWQWTLLGITQNYYWHKNLLGNGNEYGGAVDSIKHCEKRLPVKKT